MFAEADVSAVGNADEALHEEQDEMVAVTRTPKPSLLEANFGTMERPLRADLNSKDTVKQLEDYAVETSRFGYTKSYAHSIMTRTHVVGVFSRCKAVLTDGFPKLQNNQFKRIPSRKQIQ